MICGLPTEVSATFERVDDAGQVQNVLLVDQLLHLADSQNVVFEGSSEEMNAGLAVLQALSAQEVPEADDLHYLDFAQSPDRVLHARVARLDSDARRARNGFQIELLGVQVVEVVRDRLIVETHFAARGLRTVLIEEALNEELGLGLGLRGNHSLATGQNQLPTRFAEAARNVVVVVDRPELGEQVQVVVGRGHT